MTTNDPGALVYHGHNQSAPPDLFSAASMLPDVVHSDSDRPDAARPGLDAMREACELPDDLFGGNRQMRKKARTWLPQEAEETTTAWNIRVNRATCFPFYRDTLCDLAARPFGRDLSFDEEPGSEFAEFLRDVDGSGKSFSVFARDLLLNGIHRGMDWVLVNVEAMGTGETKASSENRRVYANRIDALSMLDVRDDVDETGRRRIVYCRFVTTRVKKTDEWQQEHEVVIVELEKDITTKGKSPGPGRRVEWTFDKDSSKWQASPAQAYEPGNKGIPLFAFYCQQTGHHLAEPVLEDMAWVNLAHYQSRADHAHVMRVARLITLVITGHKRPNTDPHSKGKDKVRLGPFSLLDLPAEADAKFLEPTGASIELSFRDMEQLADECKRLGARHLTSKTGNITARAVTTDDQKTVNNLQTFCVRLDVVLRQVLEAVAEWRNIELPEGVMPRTNKEFQAAGNIEGGARALQAVADALSTRQLITEAIRYGILRPDFPIDENLEELEKQREAVEAAIARAAGERDGSDDPDDDDPDPTDPDPTDE